MVGQWGLELQTSTELPLMQLCVYSVFAWVGVLPEAGLGFTRMMETGG
jgi:hypothetical protein